MNLYRRYLLQAGMCEIACDRDQSDLMPGVSVLENM